jgi:hypothetical protein
MDNEQPVYIVQRHPNPATGNTQYSVWVKDEALKISTAELGKMLADLIGSQIKEKL